MRYPTGESVGGCVKRSSVIRLASPFPLDRRVETLKTSKRKDNGMGYDGQVSVAIKCQVVPDGPSLLGPRDLVRRLVFCIRAW